MIIYFARHKCASTYTSKILRLLVYFLGQPIYAQDFQRIPFSSRSAEDTNATLERGLEDLINHDPSLLIIHNSCPEYLIHINSHYKFRGFHLIRDPRDIVVSAYFSHHYSHKTTSSYSWVADVRNELEKMPSIEEGLLYELEILEQQFADMGNWNYSNPNVLEVRFEDFVASPFNQFKRILNFCGIQVTHSFRIATLVGVINYLTCRYFCKPVARLNILPDLLLYIALRRFSFKSLSGGRKPGVADIHHHFRKGIAADWKDYFTPVVKERFKLKYGDLLIKLRYEDSLQW